MKAATDLPFYLRAQLEVSWKRIPVSVIAEFVMLDSRAGAAASLPDWVYNLTSQHLAAYSKGISTSCKSTSNRVFNAGVLLVKHHASFLTT